MLSVKEFLLRHHITAHHSALRHSLIGNDEAIGKQRHDKEKPRHHQTHLSENASGSPTTNHENYINSHLAYLSLHRELYPLREAGSQNQIPNASTSSNLLNFCGNTKIRAFLLCFCPSALKRAHILNKMEEIMHQDFCRDQNMKEG